jgi:prepilin signal peptidase PulO-like enzyme (type II secretory pathway)
MPGYDGERMMTLPAEAFVGAAIGASVGSMAGAAADRWAIGATLATPGRSACAACDVRLVRRDLVPIASWLVLRGRCRACDAPIPARLLLLEIGGAGVGGVILARYGFNPVGVLLGLVAGGLTVATLTDLASRRIPHRLTVPLAVVTLPAAILVRDAVSAWSILAWSLVLPALLLGLNGILQPLLGSDAIGGGDIRILVSVLAILALLPSAASTFLGALVATSGGVALLGLLSGRLTRSDRIPLAPFMLLAFVVAVIGEAR